jgi:hypothetical protein
MDQAMCAHTKIKEIKWNNEQHSTSSKFMCLDCNTDFIPVTDHVRQSLRYFADMQEQNKKAFITEMKNPILNIQHDKNGDMAVSCRDCPAAATSYSELRHMPNCPQYQPPHCPECRNQIRDEQDHLLDCPRAGIPTTKYRTT